MPCPVHAATLFGSPSRVPVYPSPHPPTAGKYSSRCLSTLRPRHLSPRRHRDSPARSVSETPPSTCRPTSVTKAISKPSTPTTSSPTPTISSPPAAHRSTTSTSTPSSTPSATSASSTALPRPRSPTAPTAPAASRPPPRVRRRPRRPLPVLPPARRLLRLGGRRVRRRLRRAPPPLRDRRPRPLRPLRHRGRLPGLRRRRPLPRGLHAQRPTLRLLLPRQWRLAGRRLSHRARRGPQGVGHRQHPRRHRRRPGRRVRLLHRRRSRRAPRAPPRPTVRVAPSATFPPPLNKSAPPAPSRAPSFGYSTQSTNSCASATPPPTPWPSP